MLRRRCRATRAALLRQGKTHLEVRGGAEFTLRYVLTDKLRRAILRRLSDEENSRFRSPAAMALLTVKVQETRNSYPPCDTVERTVTLPLPAKGDRIAAVFAAAAVPHGADARSDVSFSVDNLQLLAPEVAVGRHVSERARRAREREAAAHGEDADLNPLIDTTLTLRVADGAHGCARGAACTHRASCS